MKKPAIVLLALILTACGGSLSDEQRRKLREASEQQAIVKVTEAEITEAAFTKGRSVMDKLSQPNPDTGVVASAEKVNIHWLEAGKTHGLQIEQQLIEAYLTSVLAGTPLHDNVQTIGTDSVLYTNPVVVTRPDSSIEIRGTWNIWMSRKELIMAMGKK